MSTGTFLLFSFLLISVNTSPLRISKGHLGSTTNTGAQTFASSIWFKKLEFQPRTSSQLQKIDRLQASGISRNLFSRFVVHTNSEFDTSTLNSVSTALAVDGDGLNYDSCSISDGCVPPRQCGRHVGETFVPCSADLKHCQCDPGLDAFCSTNNDCDNGETCEEINTDFSVCVSKTAGSGDGLNFDSCTETDGCGGLRVCSQFEDNQFAGCRFEEPICVCAPGKDPSCDVDDDCDDGETCETKDIEVGNICVSKDSQFFEINQESSHGDEDHIHGAEEHSHGEEGHSHGEEGHSHGEEEEGHSHGEEDKDHSHGEEEEGHSHEEEEEGHSHGDEEHSHEEEEEHSHEEEEGHSHEEDEEGHSHEEDEEGHSHEEDEEGHSHGEEDKDHPHEEEEEDHSHGEEDKDHSHNDEDHSHNDEDHSHEEEGHSHGDEEHSHDEEGHSHGDEDDLIDSSSSPSEQGDGFDFSPLPSPDLDASATEEPDAASDGVCVDAMALAHLSQKELVFDQHRLAVVLCDAFGSCATPGHMVVWNGKGMMMKKYCAGVGGCEEKEIYVNSPKWKRRTRIESKTNGLEYTAFAARYETKVEEMVLRTAVQAGL